jgi:hypothetical protein
MDFAKKLSEGCAAVFFKTCALVSTEIEVF